MSRQPALHTGALLCLLGLQVWLVYRVETTLKYSAGPISVQDYQQSLPALANGVNPNNNAAFATQIHTRISALENRDLNTGTVISPEQSAPAILDGAEALAADRKLAAMLPNEPMTHEELLIFQAQLVQLPAAERHQLLAALSRAINNGRVWQKLN